jgi:lysozyme
MSVNNLTYTGERLTESFESKRNTAYDDARPNYVLQPDDTIIGTLTIGYGHTGPDVFIGQTISDDECVTLLAHDIASFAAFVNAQVTIKVTQNEFDALVDFCFNVGPGNLASSTLLRDLNAGDIQGAAAQFDNWQFSHGKKMAGLLTRREAETTLFQS